MGLSGGASGYFLSKALDNHLKESSLDKVRKTIHKDYFQSNENPEFFKNTVENLKPSFGKKTVTNVFPDINDLSGGDDFKRNREFLNDYLSKKSIDYNNKANRNLTYSHLSNLGGLGSVLYLMNDANNKSKKNK